MRMQKLLLNKKTSIKGDVLEQGLMGSDNEIHNFSND